MCADGGMRNESSCVMQRLYLSSLNGFVLCRESMKRAMEVDVADLNCF